MAKHHKLTFMGIELFGQDVGGPSETWCTRPKKGEAANYPMLLVGKDVNGKWFTIVTFYSRGLNFNSSGPINAAPSRRTALARLRNAILLARDELAGFKA